MIDKLVLELDTNLVEKAKVYAMNNRTSVSKMFETMLTDFFVSQTQSKDALNTKNGPSAPEKHKTPIDCSGYNDFLVENI